MPITRYRLVDPVEPVELRPYQKSGNEALRQRARAGCRYALSSLPTGSGKTLMQGDMLHGLTTNPVAVRDDVQGIIVEYTNIMVHQTHNALRNKFGIDAALEQGNNHADPDSKIIVASAASLVDRLEKYSRDRRRLIIIDEAHHCVAEQTKRILAGFNALKGSSSGDEFKGLLAGYTATPVRADGKGLDAVFDEIVFHIPIEDLINQGYLARPIGNRVHSNIDLEQVRLIEGEYGVDFDEQELGKAIDTNAGNKLVVDCYLQMCRPMPTIVFCVNRAHAGHVADCFRQAGVRTAALDYRSPKKTRQRAIDALKNRQLDVLVNVNLLSEGYDSPVLTAAILARPTSSEPFYRQMIGRVMRPCPEINKKYCVIVDIVHNTAKLKLSGLPTLFGIPEQFFEERQQQALDIVSVSEEINTFKKGHPQIDIGKIKDLQQLRTFSHVETVELVMAEPATELISVSKLLWLRSGESAYTLAVSNRDYMLIEKNLLNQFEVTFSRMGQESQHIGITTELEEATKMSEAFIREQCPEKIKVLSTESEWRQKDVTEKQKNYFARHNLEFDSANAKRGDATVLITRSMHLEQKRLLVNADLLIKEMLQWNDPSPEIQSLIEQLRFQRTKGDVEMSLYWRIKKISNAMKAVTLLAQLNMPKPTPFVKSIQERARQIQESLGQKGFLHENAIRKLEEIVQERTGAA